MASMKVEDAYYYVQEDEDEYYLEDEYYEFSTSDLLSQCATGTISSVAYNFLLTVGFALLQKFVLSFRCLSYSARHSLISLLGVILLLLWDIPRAVTIAMVATVCFYVILLSVPPRKHLGWTVSISTFVGLVILETTLQSDHFTYRGILMIFAMKVSSLAFDISNNKYVATVPEMFGYFLNPATVIFGPALPLNTYRTAFIYRPFWGSLWWSFPCLAYLIVSLISLLVSTCFTQLLFPSSGFLRHFADALSFRFSHYFICFWSQGLVHLGGEDSPLIVHPHEVEVPRSLAQVVALWNIPMHNYLFHYVYWRLRSFGDGISIMGTFFVSSLLHGLNGQLSLVLLSIGFASYGEKQVRDRLSRRLSACVRSRRCTTCNHRHTSSSWMTRSINGLFTLLAVYHLVYLGMPWTGTHTFYLPSHTFHIWSSHLFASHIISIAFLALALLK